MRSSLLSPESAAGLPVTKIRADFPILSRKIRGRDLVYLDNAATTHKPRSVIAAEMAVYEEFNSNVHRGVHYLSERATSAFEEARDKVRAYIGARDRREIVFTRGTTDAINLVASAWGRKNVGRGDEILLSGMEHHSNIVPWQLLAEEKDASLRVVPLNDAGEISLDDVERLISPRTKIVAFSHLSNALGTLNPVAEIVEMAHARGVPVLLDGAQAVARIRLDMETIGCDFYAFSSHKLYGPTGTGVLYGRAELLDQMPPYQGGGDMIRSVSFEKTTYNVLPYKFEAGTPNIAGAVGLGAAIDYVSSIGLSAIGAHEDDLLGYATRRLSDLPGITLVGTARHKAGVLSFLVDGVHPHDVGTILDQEGIAIRTGHHCAQPVMERFGIPATARASFAMYNTRDEVDALVKGLGRVREVLG